MCMTLVLAVVLVWVVQKSIGFYGYVKAVGKFFRISQIVRKTKIAHRNHPGNRTILCNMYKLIGWDIFACVAAFPARIKFLIANATIVKDITATRVSFPKPILKYRMLSIFSPNIIASEGDTWKKYRKISAPAFSDVCKILESLNITGDLINTVWKDTDVVEVEHVVDVTLEIALNIIGVAGFGRKMNWQADSVVPPGHTMPFHDALRFMSTGIVLIVLKTIIPLWAMGLTRKWARVRAAFDESESYMLAMIRNRRTAAKKKEKYDLFSNLLYANDDEDLVGGETKLTDEELLGNIYVFLLAGQEQEILYHHIMSIILDERNPVCTYSFKLLLLINHDLQTYEEMPLLTHSVAVLYETCRLFPPAATIPKISAEDTVLVSTNKAGERKTIPVPQGATILIDVVGLHYNPQYWKDPEMFNPSRFLGDWPREAFVPFSQGARAFMGRKFFETEGVAVLTMLITRYKITVRELPGETFEERKEIILKTRNGITLTPVHTPLVFTRRQ
ncbi:cytochrome P450 [Desarmillaria ectypa]|nr:cytochrome P450 [Desarmillaria ectypa]